MPDEIAPPSHLYRWRDAALTVDWPSDALREHGEDILSYHGVEAGSKSPAPARHWAIRFSEERRAPQLDGFREIARHQSGLRILGNDGRIVLVSGGSHARVDVGAGRIECFLAPDRRRRAELDVDLFLFTTFGLLALMQYAGSYALHAAAVRAPSGAGVLLVAESDSGKSTATLALARSGWDYLSDDSIILQESEGGLTVLPFRHEFGVDPEAADYFPEIAGWTSRQLTDGAKWRLNPDDVFSGQRADACTPDVLLFPSIVDEPVSRIEDVRPADAMMELMKQSSFLTFDARTTAAYMDVLKRLVSRCRCARLSAGRDLKSRPERIRNLITERFPDLQAP